jgi:hypothetical protein
MPERMTKEEAKIQRAIRAARIAKQTLLEETRDRMPLEVDEEEVKVKRPKAENVTIKVPNQDKEGYGLAGVEEEYKIKKATEDSYGKIKPANYPIMITFNGKSIDYEGGMTKEDAKRIIGELESTMSVLPTFDELNFS